MIYGTTTPPDKFSKLFSQQLESLRGISALIVLFSHCFQAFIAPFDQTMYSIIRLLGQSAVMMFFVLSGFLIGHSIQKNRQHFGQFNLHFYIQQRCKRILPPFVFTLVLTTFLYYLTPYFFASENRTFLYDFGLMIRSEYAISFTDFLGTSFFLNGFLTPTVSANAALWSLSYEVWFYIIAAFIPYIFYQKTPTAIFCSTIVVLILSFLNIQFLLYFLVWLFAFCLSFHPFRAYLKDQIHLLKIMFLILALAILSFDFYQFHYVYMGQFYSTENFTWFNVCIGLFFACWLIELKNSKIQFKPIFAQSAGFSYTLYVTHFPILLFIMGMFPQTLSNGLIGGVIALIISFLILVLCAKSLALFLEPQFRRSNINKKPSSKFKKPTK